MKLNAVALKETNDGKKSWMLPRFLHCRAMDLTAIGTMPMVRYGDRADQHLPL